ncbi:cell division protein FtsQ/DivIB [Oceanicola sp. 502str15]|uniref:cell division protein FtsQ/DivIB n=1 Tax=Oceanicola sp. 502str15 TaxID=2696061 RepID=UPI002094E818|nr:cell division protein FtsQ/DivIB [Oceanicola sp. 502str15]MCO6382599.1 cell division protein FtsQ [Oceanicola sp. 502str15]
MRKMKAPEAATPRRDPAPSRVAYRLERMWLTPFYRRLLRVGLPLAAVALATTWYFSDEGRRGQITGAIAEARRSVEERPEFMVKMLAVEGASEELSGDIRALVPYEFPLSSFDMNLDTTREAIEALDAVARAHVRIRPGGVLLVEIEERIPALVWRKRDGSLLLIDGEGHRVAPLLSRGLRPDLPLVVGRGADTPQAVTEARAIFAAATPLAGRLRGLIRRGERRWDVVLDRDQVIQLPEQGPAAALERVIALDEAEDMLGRDLAVIDMRIPGRPTLRMAPGAVEEFRRIKSLELGGSNG